MGLTMTGTYANFCRGPSEGIHTPSEHPSRVHAAPRHPSNHFQQWWQAREEVGADLGLLGAATPAAGTCCKWASCAAAVFGEGIAGPGGGGGLHLIRCVCLQQAYLTASTWAVCGAAMMVAVCVCGRANVRACAHVYL